MRIIPSIDLRNGHCVRLLHGDYDKETRYDADPVALAARYAGLGLDALHIVDLDGAKAGEPQSGGLIRRMVAATSAEVQAGGGIRTREHVASLLDAGAARIVVGSLAVRQPDEVARWLQAFGGDRVVLALDVRVGEDGTPRISTEAWQNTSDAELVATIRRFEAHGLKHVLCTDIGRDGALTGPAIDLYRTVLEQCPGILLQASGGVASIDDLRRLRSAGLHAAISGKALLEGRISDEEIRSF